MPQTASIHKKFEILLEFFILDKSIHFGTRNEESGDN